MNNPQTPAGWLEHAKQAFESGDFAGSKNSAMIILSNHSKSPEAKEADELLSRIREKSESGFSIFSAFGIVGMISTFIAAAYLGSKNAGPVVFYILVAGGIQSLILLAFGGMDIRIKKICRKLEID